MRKYQETLNYKRTIKHDDVPRWISVDPSADKYPDILPYAYCDWNPIKNIDSDGREKSEGNPIVSFDGSTKPNASKPETFHIK